MKLPQTVAEFVLQALEHETGGIKVYQTALKCVQNEDLKQEFEKYLEETGRHEQELLRLCDVMKIDSQAESPGREIVRDLGKSLVRAMEKALAAGDPAMAEIVACECVTLAETKDHLNWELLGHCARKLEGEMKKALQEAQQEIEDQEDEHLYHSKGWCRELWMQALGMRAVLPPPEERKHVKSAIGASRAEHASMKNR